MAVRSLTVRLKIMKIKIQDQDITIIRLGDTSEHNGVYKRKVTCEMNGKPFELDILLTPNGTGADYMDFDNFYAMNKDSVDASLTEYLFRHTSTDPQ